MNREIKFRAWLSFDEPGEGILSYQCLPLDGWDGWWIQLDPEHSGLDGVFKPGEDFTLMQYTGLKDKNGVEIYEGDVFKHTMHDSIEVVKWCDEYGGYKLPHSFDEEYQVYLGDVDGIEVIGNIYENPELLKI